LPFALIYSNTDRLKPSSKAKGKRPKKEKKNNKNTQTTKKYPKADPINH